MSRGGKCLLVGIICVVVSQLVGMMIVQSAAEGFRNARGPGDAVETVTRLSPWAGIANLAFYVGLILAIVGVILLIVDGSRSVPPPLPSDSPAPSRASSAEEENRRLREEVERLRKEGAGESG